jgi:hypothetical protein
MQCFEKKESKNIKERRKIYAASSVVRIDKFLSVKTLVGFEIFVDFFRFYEQFFVGKTNCASRCFVLILMFLSQTSK